MTTTKDIQIEIEDREYTALVIVEYSVEQNYGADRDGNRGVKRTNIDDWNVDVIRDESGRVVDMTKDMYLEVHSKIYDIDLTND